jgi:predicted Fe-S protein YdhL (DUF1289 family)
MSFKKSQNNQIKSLCIGICEIEVDSGLCSGCLRNINEIITWAILSEEARDQIVNRLHLRKIENSANEDRTK